MDALARRPAAPVLTQALVQPERVDGPSSPRIAWVDIYDVEADGAAHLRLAGRGRWSFAEIRPLIEQAQEGLERRIARQL